MLLNLFWLVVVGAVAGFAATRFMNLKTSVAETIALGVAGAIVGGFLLRLFLAFLGFIGGLIGAVLGAMLLIWLWKTYVRK